MKWGVPDQKDVEKAYHRGFEESTEGIHSPGQRGHKMIVAKTVVVVS